MAKRNRTSSENVPPRIERVSVNGQPGWLKRAERITGRMRLQKGNPIAAFEAERDAFVRLGDVGLPVPRIIDAGDDYFVTADAGPTLRAILAGGDAVLFRRALLDAARGLAALHSHGVAHGRPALKDICWDDGRVTFIDWERSRPSRNTPKGFAEDVIVFFFSAIVETEQAGPDVIAARAAYIADDRQAVWPRAVRRINRLKGLAWTLSPIIGRLQSKREFRAIAPFFAFFGRGG